MGKIRLGDDCRRSINAATVDGGEQSVRVPLSPWFDREIINATYTFPRSRITIAAVPKNACTMLKRSLLSAEGIDTSRMRSEEIHRVTQDFRSRTIDGVEEGSRLIALRDPFRRLRSAYLDKFVLHVSEEAERVTNVVWSTQHRGKARPNSFSISFVEFVNFLYFLPNDVLDVHFRPQSDFFWLNFTHVIDLEEPDCLESTLSRMNVLPLVAPEGNRTSDSGSECPIDLGPDTDALTWRSVWEKRGTLPELAQLLNPWLWYRIRDRFADDLRLRESLGMTPSTSLKLFGFRSGLNSDDLEVVVQAPSQVSAKLPKNTVAKPRKRAVGGATPTSKKSATKTVRSRTSP